MTPPPGLPQFKFVGFTGHRDLRHPVLVSESLRQALAEIQAAGPGMEWVGVSSAASGGDTLFVDKVLGAGLAWHAILPLFRHEFKEDFAPEAWAHVEKLLAKAETVIQVAPTEERAEAYLDAGLETVDRCDVLIAVWDGQPSRGKGGTAEIVTYAREIGRPIVIIDPESGQLTHEGTQAVGHKDPLIESVNKLAPAGKGWDEWPEDRPALLADFLTKADKSASAGAPHFRRMVGGTVILHVLATLIAVTAIVYHLHAVELPWIKLICLVGALVVAFVLGRSHAHHKWLRHRISAEVCRSALSAWGIHNGMTHLEEIHTGELAALIRSIQMMALRSRKRMAVSLASFKETYLRVRVANQLSYYHRREVEASRLLKRLKLGFWATTIAAIACTFAYAIAATLHIESVPESARDLVFYLCPVCLPVLAAGCLSFVSINDLQRRVARYREMQAVLGRSERQLAATHSWNAVAKVVRTTEEDLLQEVLEWHSIARYSESH